jgi:flagellar hook-associated protein FlgK
MVEVLVSQFDTAHAAGIGVRDSITQLTSTRTVANLDVPMAQIDLALPVTSGELFINVTDAAGQMKAHRIEINPGAQTVRDLGTLISEIEGLEAFIPDNGGTFGIIAEAGYTFDFTGNVPEEPFDVSMAGTAQVRMEGRRTEPGNELYEFRFADDGLIGIDDPLPLEVLDGNGQLVTLLNVGAGYEPGSPLEVTPGVYIRIENGSVNAGDSFSSYVVGDPDTSGILAATGLNTFFKGNNAKNIEVNEALLANPAMLATTTTGNPSDTTNLQRMVAVRDKRIFSNGTQTLEQYVTDIIAAVGLDVSDLEQIATNNADLQATLQGQIESSSGVDVNEEVARMLQFQRSLQAAAQYISTQNDVLTELLATIG